MRNQGFVYLFILNLLISPASAESHHPQEFLEKIKGNANEGGKIFKHFCANCHEKKPLIELGAPKIGDESQWSPRLNQGLNTLFEHTSEGFNAMPARGGCFECSDKQLFLAILYMLPSKEQKALLKQLVDHKKSVN